MAVSLLTYANRAKVAEALTAGGYPVTRMTVNRWASGSEMPGIAARMILELFGHETHERAQPGEPDWAIAMKSEVIGELQRNRQLIEALALPADLVEAAQRVIGRLEVLPPPDDEAPDDRGASEAPGGEPRQGPGVGSRPDQTVQR